MSAFLLIFVSISVWAKGNCPDSSSRELARVKASEPGVEFFACGSRLGMVRDLTVYSQREGGERERVFDGDAAVKSYRWKRASGGFDIDEAVGVGTFHPFMEVHVGCSEGLCRATDSKCVWKHTQANARIAAKIQSQAGAISDSEWTKAFVAALNGSLAARQLFSGIGLKNPAEAEHSERFSTHRADLSRLEALGCLKELR